MSTSEIPAAPKKRSFMRVWLPCIILALGLVAPVVIWTWPAENWDRIDRVTTSLFAGQLTFLLLAIWFLLFSGFRSLIRIGGILLLAALVVAAVRGVKFSGDMVPIVEFRWNRSRDDVLDAYRMGQNKAETAVSMGESETDFPEYRGRHRDGIVTGPPLTRDWKAQPPRLLWRHPVGGGYGSFAVAGNAAVTLEQRRAEEAVVCYDTLSGQERWVYSYTADFKETLGGPGPRATPTIDSGEVFSLGATGVLVCLDLATGRPKWSADILKENDNIQWGMSGSPLVLKKTVVVNPGVQSASAVGKAVVAYDRATGSLVWGAGNTRAGYSSPMLAKLAGQQQIVLFDGESLGGYDPEAGTELWRFPWPAYQGINAAQPLVLDGDRVFISTGYNVGCAMLHIEQTDGKWTANKMWDNKLMRCKFANPVFFRGFIYGLDDGILACLDANTGQRRWKEGRYSHGQLLLSGDLLFILSESGKMVVVEATPDGHHELASIQALEDKTWNCPALADGKAYLRNDLEMACYDLAGPQKK